MIEPSMVKPSMYVSVIAVSQLLFFQLPVLNLDLLTVGSNEVEVWFAAFHWIWQTVFDPCPCSLQSFHVGKVLLSSSVAARGGVKECWDASKGQVGRQRTSGVELVADGGREISPAKLLKFGIEARSPSSKSKSVETWGEGRSVEWLAQARQGRSVSAGMERSRLYGSEEGYV